MGGSSSTRPKRNWEFIRPMKRSASCPAKMKSPFIATTSRRQRSQLEKKGVEFTGPITDMGWGLVTQMAVPGGFNVSYTNRNMSRIRRQKSAGKKAAKAKVKAVKKKAKAVKKAGKAKEEEAMISSRRGLRPVFGQRPTVSFRKQRRAQIPFAQIGQHDDDQLAGVLRPLGDLNGGPRGRAATDADEPAFFAGPASRAMANASSSLHLNHFVDDVDD